MSADAQSRLEGRVAWVSGGSRGIGAAAAMRLAALGAHVVVSSRRPDGAAQTVAQIGAAGGRAEAAGCHIGDLTQIDALVQSIAERHGRLDVLVNNAATNPYFGPILDTPPEAFEKTVDVNLRGYFYATTAAIRLMRITGRGSIVNVASISALAPMHHQGIYAITKGAIITMTQAFAVEVGALGIRVNAVLPGVTRTRFASALTDDAAVADPMLARIPLKRFADPQEIAAAIAYLASDAASYTTGSCLTADGGYLAH